MSYTGSEYLERSLRKIPRYGTFQILRQRGQALDIGRHVVSGMVWMSLRPARYQNGAPSVTITEHNYKKCPMNEEHDAAEAGPSGNASDGRPPVFQTSTTSRARPRR